MAVSTQQMELFQVLEQQSEWTARQIRRSQQHGLPCGETTITEINLLEIAAAIPFIKTTDLSNESKTGMDWGWVINGGVKLFFQAKIINLTDGYSHLNHKVSGLGGRQQVDILLQYAKESKADAYYILYNGGLSDPDDNGCILLKAESIQELVKLEKQSTSASAVKYFYSWDHIKNTCDPLQWTELAKIYATNLH